jgi:2'-5' RNA ligase superfamily
MPPSPPSALLVVIPEAEPLVSAHRLQFDPVARRGVPAHVTALFPFFARDDLDADVLARVAGLAAAHHAFDHRFATTAWFDRDVLYVAPDDPAPFAGLTRALAGAFPEYPPYGGEYEDLSPHLTVAHATNATTSTELGEVEAVLRAGLPIAGRAEHLTLMTEDDDGRWSVLRRFPFASDQPR